MKYEAKNYDNLLGLRGLSDQLLKNHFTLYQGYVAKFNKLDEILVKMEEGDLYDTSEYAELNRRLGWEFNGMRLHEYYFENLTPTPKFDVGASAGLHESFPELLKKIEKEWGSYEMWEKDFKAMGMMRGIGWVILYQDKARNDAEQTQINAEERLFNVWVNEHDVGHFAGCQPLLVMDVFEHAYMLDYGLKKMEYIDAFIQAINWNIVEKRFA